MPRFPFFLAVCLSLTPLCAEHWAFQPLVRPELPANRAPHPIDRFILAKNGQTIAAEVNREPLIRRATLDLTGLPPTIAEIDAFLADDAPDAYARLIDRLLASPHYGERWGRHWLDVARYVQGTIKVDGIDRIDMAEPYRDYVVRAFNQDKPYDRFLTEQLAGDLLPRPAETAASFDQIIAPAFLAIGPWFDECTDPNKLRLDIIDEQISTLTKAVLGLDFACARCHDHKFDPIPTRDYYALAGILRSTKITSHFAEFWRDGRPRLTQRLENRAQREQAEKIQVRLQKWRTARWETLVAARKNLTAQVAAEESRYREALASLPVLASVEFEAENYAGQKNLRGFPDEDGPVIGTRKRQEQWVKFYVDVPENGRFSLHARYAAAEPVSVNVEINGKLRQEAAFGRATGGWGDEHQAWMPAGAYDLRKGRTLIRLLAQRHEWFPRLDKLRLTRVAKAPVATFGEKPGNPALNPEILDFRWKFPDAWPPTIAETERFLAEPRKLAEIDARIDELQDLLAERPIALAVAEGEPVDLPVHIGGQVYQTEDAPVPRAVPTLGQVSRPNIPPNSSGRLELARWLTNPQNPLTARVMVNRIWHWHFGRGIVATNADFGTQGAAPTHPELLDWLAAEFSASGWSVKAMHRLIMTSATYRQGSKSEIRDPKLEIRDAFVPRRRLEAEAIYDSMLSTIGKVPRQPAGPLDVAKSKDRALYILTSDRSPVGLGLEIRKMLGLFGFDASGVPMHARSTAETPAQALFWLNNPLPRYYAEKFAERLLAQPNLDESGRIILAFRTALGATPDPDKVTKTRDYLDFCRTREKLSERDAWARVCLGIFSSEAFRFLE